MTTKNQSEPNNTVLSFEAGNGQAAQSSVEIQEQDKGAQPEFVTQKEMMGLKTALEESIQKAISRAQSLVDSSEHRLTEKIKSRIAEVEKSIQFAESSGVELTEAQKESMRSRARDEVLMGKAAGEEEPGSSFSDTSEDELDNSAQDSLAPSKGDSPTTAAGKEIMRDVGVVVTDTDPEAGMIDRSTRGKYLASLEQAAIAKKARLASQGAGTPTSAGMGGQTHKETIGARVAKGEVTPDDLWKQIGL